MRRILRLNLEAEGLEATEVGTAHDCRRCVQDGRPAAVVLDPRITPSEAEADGLYMLLRESGLPVLVVSDRPEHRAISRALGGAPFCNRPDDVDRVTAAVHTLIAGARLPSVV
jgi:DNA-binding NtrC family response regulator